MNQIRNGINTRLESRKNFDNMRSNFLQDRVEQDQQIIKPINQDDFVNFHSFANDYESYSVDEPKTKKNVNEQFEKYVQERKLTNNNQPNNNIFLNIQENNQQKDLLEQKQKESAKKEKLQKQLELDRIKKKKQEQEQVLYREQQIRKRIEREMERKNLEIQKQKQIINNLQNTKKQQVYVPEIGKKRKLINALLQVLKRRNLNTNEDVIHKYLERYNISYDKIDRNALSQIIFEIKQQSNKPKFNTDVEFEEETRVNSFLVSINSKDRDKTKWKCPNEYSISFAPQSGTKTGYINRSFDNVISVQLVSAIFPKNSLNGNNLEDYPYIILEIDELGSNYEGTNDYTSKAFAQLTFDLDMGKYKKLVSRNDIEYKKYFNPRVSLNKFTIRIKTPDGQLYDFGKKNDNQTIDNSETEEQQNLVVSDQPMTDTEITDFSNKKFTYDPNDLDFLTDNTSSNNNTSNSDESNSSVTNENQTNIDIEYEPINLVFKICCIQRKLENMYLNRRDS